MARKTPNIFGKTPRQKSEPGFQGLIARYFARRQPRVSANPIPPYRLLYNKPSLKRVGTWLAAQDRFFKTAWRWRQFIIAVFYFSCGAIVAAVLYFFLVWSQNQPQFKNKSTRAIVVAVAQQVKIKSLALARRAKQRATSINGAAIKKSIKQLEKKIP